VKIAQAFAVASILFVAAIAQAQQPGQPQLKIDSTNRTLTVRGEERVSVDPEIAILHVGFDTQPQDAKSAYAEGARTSNAIIAAIKQAGIPDSAIHSESQFLSRDWSKPHKFTLTQQWTVRVPPERAAEILDIAVTAGATSSGDIDWTVKDQHALEAQALDKASARARENAEVLARGMGVRLGPLLYASNELGTPALPRMRALSEFVGAAKTADQPLAIEPHKVDADATVYAVFAIE
jgi:uncharacterized protein YggE